MYIITDTKAKSEVKCCRTLKIRRGYGNHDFEVWIHFPWTVFAGGCCWDANTSKIAFHGQETQVQKSASTSSKVEAYLFEQEIFGIVLRDLPLDIQKSSRRQRRDVEKLGHLMAAVRAKGQKSDFVSYKFCVLQICGCWMAARYNFGIKSKHTRVGWES